MSSQESPDHHKKISSYVILALAIFVPASFALYLALNAGNIPSHDYWGIISVILSSDGYTNHVADWFVRQNGHILFVPSIIYALNIKLANGSNLGLTLTAWFLALFQTLLLIKLLPSSVKNWTTRVLLVFTVSAFSFTPSAVDHWTLGFSGVHWIAANVMAVGAIACLTFYYHRQKNVWILGSGLLAIFATVTYGTSLALWLALCFGTVIFLPRLRTGLVFIGSTLIVFYGYYSFIGQQITIEPSQSVHTNSVVQRIGPILRYAIIYLGAIFSTDVSGAFILGLVGALASVAIFGYTLFGKGRNDRLDLLPWLLLQVYIIGNAFITALVRVHLSIEQAITSRYATLPALFWASLIVILVYYLCRIAPTQTWYIHGPAYLATLLLILVMYPIGVTRAEEYFHQISLQPLAVLSAKLGIPDDIAIYHAITIVPGQFVTMIPTLKQHGHIPFDQTDTSCGKYNEPISSHLLHQYSPNDVSGYFDFMEGYSADGFRVVGWASTNSQIKCIVLLNENNTIRGFALPGFYRPDVAEILELSDLYTGWIGYARITSAEEQLNTYVLIEGNDQWYPLHNTRSPGNPGEVDPNIYTAYYYGWQQ